MASFATETVNGVPITTRLGHHFLLMIMIGESYSHNVRMVEEVEVGRNALHTWIQLEVSEAQSQSRILMLELEKVVVSPDSSFLDKPKAIDSDFCFIKSGPGPSAISKEGNTWYSSDHKPFRFVIPLKELTSGGKMIQFIQFRRCVGDVLHEVVIDVNITVIKDAPDKVPEHLTRKLMDKLVENDVYEASSTLRKFGCNSLKDLESLSAEDIVNFPLPELTMRKLLMLAGCRKFDCAFTLKRTHEGDGSAFLLKRAREGDGSARKGDG